MSSSDSTNWPRVAVVGAGAVGCYFGGMLARAGARVTLIGRPKKGDSAAGAPAATNEIFLDSIHFQERVRVTRADDPRAVRDADLVLVSVKTVDTEEAARGIAPHLRAGAIVVSLQNGVENVEQMRTAAGIDALPAVVYVAAAMAAPGRVKHSARGDLVLGHATRKDDVARVAAWFTRAGVPCRISENLESDLWVKLIMNCAGNAISALARATYGRVTANELGRQLVRATIEECVAVARAAGVALPLTDLVAAGLKLLSQDLAAAISSTAQDIARGKRTEIDALNGTIVRRGAALGVPTPVNQALYALVKLLEESVSRDPLPPAP